MATALAMKKLIDYMNKFWETLGECMFRCVFEGGKRILSANMIYGEVRNMFLLRCDRCKVKSGVNRDDGCPITEGRKRADEMTSYTPSQDIAAFLQTLKLPESLRPREVSLCLKKFASIKINLRSSHFHCATRQAPSTLTILLPPWSDAVPDESLRFGSDRASRCFMQLKATPL